MPKQPFKLSPETVVLPKGTRVVLRFPQTGPDGKTFRAGSLGTVKEVQYHTYTIETPSGDQLSLQRDQITPQREDLLESMGRRQWDYSRLQDQVIYSAVLGSQAWGLADASSDEDVRGCFLAPFEVTNSLWDSPMDLEDPSGENAYWEVEKFITQGLKGDANTLETLWSPLHRVVTPLGERLLEERDMFISMNVLGSFGRYAQSQFKKIERSLQRDLYIGELLEAIEKEGLSSRDQAMDHLLKIKACKDKRQAKDEILSVCRSFQNRGLIPSVEFSSLAEAIGEGRREELQPKPFRPKNAYNLLRLLHSCVHWLQKGQPLITVTGDLRKTLLEIKAGETPIETTLAMAREAAREVDEAGRNATLPDQPNFERADDFLRHCRQQAARTYLALSPGKKESLLSVPQDEPPCVLPTALPQDIDPVALKTFFQPYLDPDSANYAGVFWLALSGSHAYGFPSPDSDLDLKGTYAASSRSFLGLGKPPGPIDFLGDHQGREYDLTLNELGQTIQLVLQGNGNMIERFLGPFPLITTPEGKVFCGLVKAALSRRVFKHYGGFFKGMQREHQVEVKKGKCTAKTLLYGYRVALTGIHLLRSGDVETNVGALAEEYGFKDPVARLIECKKTAEFSTMPPEDCRSFQRDWSALEASLEDARETSALPEEPAGLADMERFLFELRGVVT